MSVRAAVAGSSVFAPLLVALASCQPQAPAARPVPRVAWVAGGQSRAEWDVATLLRRAKAETVRVWDPQEQAEVSFRAVPLVPLLDQALGPAWRQASDLLFVARDGYTAPVAVSRVLAKPAWLAVGRVATGAGEGPLVLTPKGRAALDAGPVYLIWDSLNDAAVRAEGDHGWPYQTVRIEAVDLLARYPQLAVATLPAEATQAAQVQRGQHVVARYCLPCHAIGGQGGQVGPELVSPVGVVHTWQPYWLARWIDDPAQVRPASKMPRPPLPPGDRRQHVADIVAYLQARTPLPPTR